MRVTILSNPLFKSKKLTFDMKNQIIWGIVCLIQLLSCTEQKNKEASELLEFSVNINNEIKSVQFSDLIKETPKFIFLETNAASLIGKIDKVVITEKYIYILDTFIAGTIFIFDNEGNFIKRLASQGEGPNEYMKPTDIVVGKENIWVLDNGRSIKTFDFSGKKVSEIKLTAFSAIKFEKLKNENILAFISGNIDDNLIIADENGAIIDSYFPYISRRSDRIIINPIYKSFDDDKIIYRREFNDTLYAIYSNGLFHPHKYINYGNYTLGKEFDKENHTDEDLKNYALTRYYYENLKNEYLVFSINNDFWIRIYDKSSNISKLFKYTTYENDFTIEKDSYIIGTTKDHFIYQVYPNSLKTNEELIKSSKSNQLSSEFLDNLSKLKSDDNPILMLVDYDFSLN